jgi:hypothetical protein
MLFVWTELRRSVRSLSKSPALAAVAIFSLALGIGANVTVYSVVREMILDDVSAQCPDRLAFVDGANASYSMYRDLRSAGAFQDLAFHRGIHDRIWHSETNDIAWILTTTANCLGCDKRRSRASRRRRDSGASLGTRGHRAVGRFTSQRCESLGRLSVLRNCVSTDFNRRHSSLDPRPTRRPDRSSSRIKAGVAVPVLSFGISFLQRFHNFLT